MKLRLVQFNLGKGRLMDAEAIADKVVPSIRARPGCETCEFFADSEMGDYGLVVLWSSKDAADAAAEVIGPILSEAMAQAHSYAVIRLFDIYEPKK